MTTYVYLSLLTMFLPGIWKCPLVIDYLLLALADLNSMYVYDIVSLSFRQNQSLLI